MVLNIVLLLKAQVLLLGIMRTFIIMMTAIRWDMVIISSFNNLPSQYLHTYANENIFLKVVVRKRKNKKAIQLAFTAYTY